MSEEIGWAVVSGRILIKTVSDTRRAAIVNYLVVAHGVPVSSNWTDADIENAWDHFGKWSECRQVCISDHVESPKQREGS